MGKSVQYFLGIDGEQVGPFSKQEVLDKVLQKEVREADMIWWEGQDEWLPLSETEFFKETKPVKEPKRQPKVDVQNDKDDENVFERKRPQIGGDVESVLSGKSSLESHPTFAQGPNAEPAFKMSQASNLPIVSHKLRLILTVVAVLAVVSGLYLYFTSSSDEVLTTQTTLKKKVRSLKDRQAVFSTAVSTLMTNSPTSIAELQNLIKENPNDEISKQAIEQLTSFYRTMQRYNDAGQLMMQVNRPDEATRFFSLDPSLTLETEKSTWEAYKVAKGEERKQFLLQNIQLLVGPLQDIPKAIERIKLFESEFPKVPHPYGYYLKGTDEKISDLFSRTSFYFVQNLISYLVTELPQLKLSARPLVEIKKSKTDLYKIVGSYKGDVILNQDKLNEVFFTFWFANETWHIVDTNLTKERRAYAIKERSKISSLSMSGEVMLKYMEGVFRAQFPKVALHEYVDAKK